MNLLYRLAYIGTQFAFNPSERRSILLSNLVGLIIFVTGAVLTVLYYIWFGWSIITICIPIISVLALSALVLNHYNYSVVSRILVSLLLPISVMALSIYSKSIYYYRQEELDYFTFRFIILSSCVFAPVFFSVKNQKALLIFTAFSGLFTLLMYDPLHNFFNVPYKAGMLIESNYSFTNVVIAATYLILLAVVIFLKATLERSENRSEQLITKLNITNDQLLVQNAKIENQNLEIRNQADNLNKKKIQLQEANTIIEEQRNLLLRQNKNLSLELLEKNKNLTETNSELIKHNNELRQFSYTVSHNLRGPVASLLGLIGLIDIHKFSDSEAEIINHIKLATKQLDVIIKDLSKIIDIRNDIFQIRQKVNLEKEILQIRQIFMRELSLHNISLQFDINDCHSIYSVRPMIHSILYNLIGNAIKYRSPQRNAIISVHSEENNEFYTLKISDNGLGIDLVRNEDNLFKLYKRFHYHTEGKGLGLYLVKLQVEALGGSIEVESEINRYTTFTIKIKKPENIERQILFNQAYAQIFYDARINCIGIIWKKSVTSEQYRSVFKNCMELVKVYNTPNYIADLTNHGSVSKEDQIWIFQDILPEAIKNGLNRIGAVHPAYFHPRIKEYFQLVRNNLSALGAKEQFFVTIEEAVEWIQEENEKVSLKLN